MGHTVVDAGGHEAELITDSQHRFNKLQIGTQSTINEKITGRINLIDR